ncbi:hypothetical protein EUGRSUZ_F04418 [Eucalyptus grandis]|uniref:DUF4220 domain-containing protein n=2 Tax=Eucalyptus grandis TaxID=71139 RepID=A0A059BZB5_EUCGR|nr:hypothetical protein EUGRSUZ_F04418 [Eucalyptus grandis]
MQDGFSIICNKVGAAAIKPVETELGFSCILQTEATSVHSIKGLFLHFVSFLFPVFVLVSSTFLDDKLSYSSVDRGITLSLLVEAIVLEIYGAVLLTFSDSTLSQLADQYRSRPNMITLAIFVS